MPRRKRQKPSLPPVGREMGAAALAAVRGRSGAVEGYQRSADGALLVVGRKGADGAVAGVVRALGDPLDFYLHRAMISQDEHTAGDTLRRDHFSAFGSGYHAVNLEGFHGCSNAADNWRFSPFKSDRMRDFIAATNALDRKTAKLVELVVIRGVFANEAARQIGEPRREGFRILKAGLGALATFYRRGLAVGRGSNQGRRHQRNPAPPA
jgi:hypothetical protein